MKTSELQGAALDWAVAECEGLEVFIDDGVVRLSVIPEDEQSLLFQSDLWFPSEDWYQAGSIIEQEGISLNLVTDALWEATIMGEWAEDGPTPLIAAMRCYVGSQLGNEVEIPKGLGEVNA